MMDPTYTGLNRSSLQPLPSSSTSTVMTFKHAPPVRLGGRGKRTTSPTKTKPRFTDNHGIGYSIFDDKGSVLMANVDAVLNLTKHIGGYVATGTKDANEKFYSLLFEDHNLEMHSYVQFRRPLSVCRVIMNHTITKPFLKTAQLDTILKTDVSNIIDLKPCSGYNIIGLISHEKIGLRELLSNVLLSLAVIDKTDGVSFIVFPFGVDEDSSGGSMTYDSVIDICYFISLIFKRVWLFRPYMSYSSLVCLAYAEPRDDPPEKSDDENILVGLWDSLGLLSDHPPSFIREIHPTIAKAAEVDDIILGKKKPTTVLKFEATRNFSRIFDGSKIGNEQLIKQVKRILSSPEITEKDRVEVLSRWQLPDTIDTSVYPF